jgi:hypothetical protein
MPEFEFLDAEETSKQLIISGYEEPMRRDLETGARRPCQRQYKSINGLPLSTSITSITATTSGEVTSENVNFRYGEEGVLFSADSMTKTITAACILRMVEEENYNRYLPRQLETNLGYELLGAILVAIHSEANNKPATENSQYGEVVNELVMTPVKEKMIASNAAEAAQNLQFFTSDQMTSEIPARFGKAFHQEELSEIPSHTYDIACGGSYATSDSMAHIALHILSDKSELSIFRPQTLDLLNQPESSVEANKNMRYGLGFYSFKAAPFFRFHGGLGYGSNSQMSVNNSENKAAVVMVAFEQNLTLPLAHALVNQTRVVEGLIPDQQLYEKSEELRQHYSEEQRLEMRIDLQQSYERFSEKFDQFEQARISESARPSTHPRQQNATSLDGEERSLSH